MEERKPLPYVRHRLYKDDLRAMTNQRGTNEKSTVATSTPASTIRQKWASTNSMPADPTSSASLRCMDDAIGYPRVDEAHHRVSAQGFK
jgi:hypothetical protein